MACATALSGMRSFMGNHTVGRDFLFGAYLSSPCLDIPSAWNWAPCRYGAGRSSVVPPVYGPLCRFYSPPVGLRRSLTGDKMRPSPWTSGDRNAGDKQCSRTTCHLEALDPACAQCFNPIFDWRRLWSFHLATAWDFRGRIGLCARQVRVVDCHA